MLQNRRVSGLRDIGPKITAASVTAVFETDLLLMGGDGSHGVNVYAESGDSRINLSLGGIGFGSDASLAYRLYSNGSTSTTQPISAYFRPTIASTATTAYGGYVSFPATEAAAFTLPILSHFIASQGTIGAASAVTTQTGFEVQSSLTGATTNYGFRGSIAAASGRYNLYMDGTGQNYLAGVTGIGVAASSTSALTLAASTTGVSSLRVPHGAAPSSPVNGDMWTTTAGLYVRINGATVGPLS